MNDTLPCSFANASGVKPSLFGLVGFEPASSSFRTMAVCLTIERRSFCVNTESEAWQEYEARRAPTRIWRRRGVGCRPRNQPRQQARCRSPKVRLRHVHDPKMPVIQRSYKIDRYLTMASVRLGVQSNSMQASGTALWSAVRPESPSALRTSTELLEAISLMCSNEPCMAIVRNASLAFGQ